jgi:hypothetical protein
MRTLLNLARRVVNAVRRRAPGGTLLAEYLRAFNRPRIYLP